MVCFISNNFHISLKLQKEIYYFKFSDHISDRIYNHLTKGIIYQGNTLGEKFLNLEREIVCIVRNVSLADTDYLNLIFFAAKALILISSHP